MRVSSVREARHRGQSMVEFALVAPLLFLMIALLIDFGRLVYVYSAISNASKEGARTLSLVPQSNSDCAAIQRVLAVAQGFRLRPDPNSRAGNNDANIQPGQPGYVASKAPYGPSTQPVPPGTGYFYIWPAVAQAVPQDQGTNCDADPNAPPQRPVGPPGPTRDVEVQITYHFTPLTPIVSGFVKDFNIKTLSVTRTEY